MYNVYVFKYLRVSSKEQNYDYQREKIDNNLDELVKYIDSKDNLKIKEVIEVKEKASSTKRKQTKLDEMFKQIDTIDSLDKSSIFVILVSDHTRFMRSFMPFCKAYFSMANNLGEIGKIYNRFVIKFGYSDCSKFEDLFHYNSDRIGEQLTVLLGMVRSEEMNMRMKIDSIKAGLRHSKKVGVVKDQMLYTKKFLHEILTNKKLWGLNISDIANVLKVNRRTIYARFEELISDDIKTVLSMLKSGKVRVCDDFLNKLKVYENSYVSDGLTFDKNNFDIVKIEKS